ncbi:MAG: SDR family oxidoreductase [Proteobacteria bacterium]|nr:SDR family oxidoreductase [Pseudomonadota bacterium]
MSRRWTDQDRTRAMAALELNGGNVSLTGKQLDIPRRTIAMWRDHAIEAGAQLPVPADRQADWQAVLAESVAKFGGLNILVNNAGISAGGNVEDTDFETWKRVHAVDLDGVFLGCKHAIRHIHAAGGGAIVNISSISGIIAGHNTASYSSAKAGVRLLSKSVALHCAKRGYDIRCNSVHPAYIKTPILDPLVRRLGAEEAYAKLGRQIPLGRIGEPDDVAYGVLYLASDESRFVTGIELVIDGGISAM